MKMPNKRKLATLPVDKFTPKALNSRAGPLRPRAM